MNATHVRAGILLLGVSALFSIALCEGALRLLAAAGTSVGNEIRRRDPAAVLVVPLGELGFAQRPGASIRYGNGTVATANSLGFRGPLVERPKPPNVFRVVLLGGSTTHGWFVDDTATVDAYMRSELRERRPDVDVEVVNLAYDGYDSYQIMLRFLEDGLRFEPDVVIVNAGNVDVANARFSDLRDGDPRTLIWGGVVEELRAEQQRGRPLLWNRVKHLSYVARLPQFVRQLWRNRPSNRAGSSDAEPEAVYLDAADYYERNLIRLVDAATAHGMTVVLAAEPWSRENLESLPASVRSRYHLKDPKATAAYRDTLASRTRAVATRFADEDRDVTYLSFDPIPSGDFLDDAHLLASGNRLVARQLVDALTSLLPSRTAAGQLIETPTLRPR